MNNNTNNIELKNKLYTLLAMHNYQVIADFEDILSSIDDNTNMGYQKALIGHVETLLDISFEAYSMILNKFYES